MFERYTEAARRTLFFARYEVSEMGALALEPEHVLLGVLRVDKGPIRTLFAQAQLSFDSARAAIHARSGVREKFAQSVEIPFSAATQRVLHYAAEEADRLLHSDIGTEHLLLGLLREQGSVAASILASHGLTLDGVRDAVVQLLAEAARSSSETANHRVEPRDEIDDIKLRIDELGLFHLADDQVRDLIARIRRDLDELKRHLE
jgi:ATP-dependent Clp protease ATP-binding subunit ClpC